MNFGPPLRPHRNHFFLGLDLGQRCDHSALVILERVHELTGNFDHANYVHETATRLYLRHAERFPLHFPYLAIPQAIKSTFPSLDPTAHHAAPAPKTLAIDATGVGAPVVEILHRAHLHATILPITITSGAEPNGYNVPRATLLSNLRILLETGLLRFTPQVPHFDQLFKELQTLSAATRAQHDDLAFALALAAWPAASSILDANHGDSNGDNANTSHNIRNTPRGYPSGSNRSSRFL
jgi:hypothetical protein